MLLGVYADGKEYQNIKGYDISSHKVIVFDEIKMDSPKMLKK